MAGSGSIANKAFAVLLNHSIETVISAKELGSLQGEANKVYACLTLCTTYASFIVTSAYAFNRILLLAVFCISV